MTTIAYRDGVMAADTLCTVNNAIEGRVVKIARRGPIMAGAAGSAPMCRAFLDWFKAGMKGDPPATQHPVSSDWNYWGLIVTPDHILSLMGSGWMTVSAPYHAMGSGAEYALGAMAAGATAVQAVEAAIRHDTRSGGDITVLRADGA